MDEISSDRSGKESRSGRVQSVERAMTILETLSSDEEGFRLTELATRTALSPSTVHRLLTTLEQRQFVHYDPTNSRWHVGRAAFTVGSTFAQRRNFVAPALPFLRRLRDQTRETVNLGVLEDREVVVLTQVESREIMRAITRVGGRVSCIASGMGLAILATFPDDQITSLLDDQHLKQQLAQNKLQISALQEQLATSRKRGYAIDDQQFLAGLRCVAAVVYDAKAEPLCAISVSGLSIRVSDHRLDAIGELVRDTANELTVTLGGKLPSL